MKSHIQRVLRAAIVFSPAVRCMLSCAIWCVFTVSCPAVETKVIRDESFQSFNQGESTGTELLSLGRLRIAPKVNRIEKGEEGVAWDVAVDPYDGNVFYSTGHNGKVYRYQPGGKTELWADLSEVEAISVAVDATGGVLIGASPGGKIYRAAKSGKPEVFFDTKEQYIWDMIFDRNGVLYAATGPNGKIYRIRGQNNGEVYYDSDATNVMALGFNSEGRLLAATQGKAFVLRVDAPREAYVLYSATEDECRSLTVDNEGNIYAAINGARSSAADTSDKDEKGASIFGESAGSRSPSPTPTPGPSSPSKSPESSASSSGFSLFSSGSSSGQSVVVQIQPSGFASPFWTAPEGPIQSMIQSPFGDGLLIAAGKKGKIYHLGRDANYSVVGDVEEPNVLALAAFKAHVYLTTANKGSLYEMANTTTREGIFASRAMNAGGTVHWGNIYYESEETSGAEVIFESRSGNTSEPDDNSWSPWIAATRVAPKIVRVESPVAQYLQYRVTLRAAPDGTSPVVDKVQAFYVQKNAAPVIRSVNVQKAGDPGSMSSPAMLSARRATPTPPAGASTGSSSSAGSNPFSSSSSIAGLSSLMSSMSGRSSSETDGADSRPSGSSISVATNSQKVNITWNVTDPNGDKLRSMLYFKGEDESEWKLIEKELTTSNFVFSTEAIPDGKYRFKVEVTDSAENPETSASTVSLSSQIYIVDNSPPDILKLTGAKVGTDEYEIVSEATDKTSIIAAAEFNINAAKEWRAAFPEDGIFDFNQESFRWRVKPETEKPTTEHTLSLRVYDREGNSRVEKVLLK